MKKVYSMLVCEDTTERMEKTLNSNRIALNDWDRSKTFELNGVRLVNYTIVCTEDQFVSITNIMHE